MADWIDTLYERNWHEFPELDVKKLEAEALQMAIAHNRDSTPIARARLNDVLLQAQQIYAGYMNQMETAMRQMQDGTYPQESLEAMRAEQRRRWHRG
jgi:hypothetical protein